jgi:hypothetical protein
MKLFYKPFSLFAGLVGARIGQQVFRAMWARLDDSDPPHPESGEGSLPKVVGARALEAATMAGVAAAIDHTSAKSFHYLTGIWPGPKKRAPKKEIAKR